MSGLVELLILPQGALRARVGDWAIDASSYPDFADLRDAVSGLTISGWTTGEGVARLPGGVTPDGFRGHFAEHRQGIEFWLPFQQHPQLSGPDDVRSNRDVDWVRIPERLSAGTTLVDAKGVVSSVMAVEPIVAMRAE